MFTHNQRKGIYGLGRVLFAYFPIICALLQIFVNAMFFFAPNIYNEYGFYLANLFGQTVLFGLLMSIYTNLFRFCFVSRYAAYAQLFNSLAYIVIKSDNVYNIVLQIVTLSLAITFTAHYCIVKHPECTLAHIKNVTLKLFKTGDCMKALEEFRDERTDYYLKKNQHA